MKTKIFILLFAFISGVALAQRGQLTDVKSEFSVMNDHYKRIKCKFITKINDIENDTLNYVSIQIDNDHGVNNGYIYLSNDNELNEFKEDLKLVIPKVKANELYQVGNSRYMLDIVQDSVISKRTFINDFYKPDFRIRLYEVRLESSKTFISFYADVAEKLLSWLDTLKF